MANDLDLSSNLSRLSKIEAEKGLAAKAPIAEHVGKRTKYELHHVTPISENGAIYDIDNIMILTPKAHIESHSKNGEKLK
ncbi:Colicin-E9 [compost metagenome]